MGNFWLRIPDSYLRCLHFVVIPNIWIIKPVGGVQLQIIFKINLKTNAFDANPSGTKKKSQQNEIFIPSIAPAGVYASSLISR